MKKKYLASLLISFTYTLLFSQNFTEVSNESGIYHVYQQFSNMGGGAVFFDYDNDGWEDLYITGGIGEDSLYKNLGNGNFSLVNDSWLDITRDYYTVGVVSGDVNNDGFRDLYVTTWREVSNGTMSGSLQRNLLFINNTDGSFTERSLDYNMDSPSFSMGAAMFDYNKDGLLDLYVVNYMETSRVTYDDNHEINGFDHDCYANQFYLNNGNGTFTEIGAALGVNNIGCALSVMPTDFDQDNDQDIYVANDFGEFVETNAILQNNYPTNQFTDMSVATNMDVEMYGMGIAYADIDKDGDFDYYITNLGRNVLLKNNGSQVFSDISTSANVENTYAENNGNTLFTTSWGTAFLDINNDTWPDLFVVNGRVPAADFIATGEDDPNKLYMNNGDATFTDVSNSAGIADYNRGRGIAYSDYDKDGDLDMIVVVQDGSPDINAKTMLYQNQLNPNDTSTDDDNWVQFELEGTDINRDAIGAKIEITVNGEKTIQEVHGQGSHCSQHSLVLHFGMGDNTSIDQLKIVWSATDIQVASNIDINMRHAFKQGESLGVNDENGFSKITAYPNPTKNKLYFKNIATDCLLEIYTIQGVLIKNKNINRIENYLELNNLATGIYIYKLIDAENNFVTTDLIIKE